MLIESVLHALVDTFGFKVGQRRYWSKYSAFLHEKGAIETATREQRNARRRAFGGFSSRLQTHSRRRSEVQVNFGVGSAKSKVKKTPDRLLQTVEGFSLFLYSTDFRPSK